MKITIYIPMENDNKLLNPANASILVSNEGNAAKVGANDAAFILALPTPLAIAKANGCKGRSDTEILVKKLIKTVPMIVPTINNAKIPLDSGELNPYLSTTTATSGSRPIELVIPIVSLLNPKSNATGSAIKIVAK